MSSSPESGFWVVAVQLDQPQWSADSARQLVEEVHRSWRVHAQQADVVAPFEIRIAEHPASNGVYWIVSHLMRNAPSADTADAAVNAVLRPAIARVNPGATSRSFVAYVE